MEKINIIWFKKDLRLLDHAPLYAAACEGLPVLLLFVFEPSLQKYPDWSIRHWTFMLASLKELNKDLEKYNLQIYIVHSEIIEILEEIKQNFDIKNIFSYQETGTKIVENRNLLVEEFCQKNSISWVEFQKNGVIKNLENLKNWENMWYEFMEKDIENPNLENLKNVTWELPTQFYISYQLAKKLENNDKNTQIAGEQAALKYLKSFLKNKSQDQTKHHSKLEVSLQNYARLSVYLTYGNLSIRQVFKAYQKSKNPQNTVIEYLKRRIYSIQKFEIEKNIEYENFNKAYDNLDIEKNINHLEAWKNAITGFPLIDASMRCVKTTGYLDFRLRAILVSFLTHHLGQNWQDGVYFLAQQFLDYEMGLHFVQFQLQAGTFGFYKIYDPIKEAQKYDIEASFIKTWLPELADLPNDLALCPCKITSLEEKFYKFELGKNYPFPIINLNESMEKAKKDLITVKQSPLFLSEKQRIIKKYGRLKIKYIK